MTFLFPFLLGALALVPALWWILRALPPRPRVVRFPAFFLLKDIQSNIQTAARTPWWLLLLRSVIVVLFIAALAEPVSRLTENLPAGEGSVLLVVDNGWAAAAQWEKRTARLREYLPQIGRSGRTVVFLPTAASAQDGRIGSFGPMDAAAAEKWLEQLSPRPWRPDHAETAQQIAALAGRTRISYALFFSDGVVADKQGTDALLAASRITGGMTLVRDDVVNAPYILRREELAGKFAFSVERLALPQGEEKMTLVAYAAGGSVVDEKEFTFAAGQRKTMVEWEIVPDMRSRIARIGLRGVPMASAVLLMDSAAQQKPVGIAADPARGDNESFLNEVYYLRRALEGGGTVDVNTPEVLLQKPLSAVIWPDSAALAAVERVALLDWVENGGFLIRFAGSNLAANPDDPLLPVALRHGQRAMQGALTWEKPLALGGMPDHSPLAGLQVPKDVTVTRQILANPTPETLEKTWMQLEDGTPLVTGGPVGKGMVVLVHTTAGPEWSNFCYSGLYVEALQRMVALGNGVSGFKAAETISPLSLLDGFGRLAPPQARDVARPFDARGAFVPSPETPPGIYGAEQQFFAYNLGDRLATMTPLGDVPAHIAVQTYQLAGERSLKADLLKIALWLLALDTVLMLWLRGIITLPAKRAAPVLLALLLAATPAAAQVPEESERASTVNFAYIETGDMETDRISHNGLTGLKNVVNMRTNIKVRDVVGVNPATDALYFYPFLYWPMTDAQTALPASAARKLQDYMAQGGMIVFDTRDQQFAAGETGDASGIGTRRLRRLTSHLRISELMPVADGHILTKSFYLMDAFPGLYGGGRLWVEKEPSQSHDTVTSVIIGGNDWASAWSDHAADRARLVPVPGGARQREMAYRFGVNMVMVALSGNYKADQVHVPYILERLNR